MGIFFNRKKDSPSKPDHFVMYVDYFTEIVDDMYLYSTSSKYEDKVHDYRFRREHRATLDNNYMIFDTYQSHYIYERKDGLYESQGFKFRDPRQALVCLLLYWHIDRSYPARYYHYLND